MSFLSRIGSLFRVKPYAPPPGMFPAPGPVIIPGFGAMIRRTSGLSARATPGTSGSGGGGGSSGSRTCPTRLPRRCSTFPWAP